MDNSEISTILQTLYTNLQIAINQAFQWQKNIIQIQKQDPSVGSRFSNINKKQKNTKNKSCISYWFDI